MNVKTVHLAFGAFVVMAFLLTGQYMDHAHHHLKGMPDGPRLLYRTRHIYILLSGLLNLCLGTYLVVRTRLWRKVCQAVGSVLIMLASVLFMAAFYYEPRLRDLQTPLSHWGAYVIVAGVLLHIISSLGEEKGATGS